MAFAGNFFVWLGLISSVVLFFLSIYGGRNKNSSKGLIDFWVLLPAFFSAAASIVLIAAFVGRHFEFDYVVRYSSSDLPLFYTITAFWAGQEGSLLLWTLLLSIFAVIFWYAARKKSYSNLALSVVSATLSFFYLVNAIPASPFKLLPQKAAEGFGLNPLLQNLGMVFHPPTVFFAYALYTFPFAIAISVLLTKSFKDKEWLKDMRLWTLFAWLFMGIGNVLGALWAYVELGWGGFWAWDPVENASLLPWLTGTALLHSITIYEKRKTLKVWTYVLAIITFFLCILGTYITRSGTIASVHAFEKSPIAIYFLIAMILIIFVPLYILARRYKEVEPTDIQNYATREGTYAISNWLFLAFAVVVLYGTLFPLFSSIFTGVQAQADEGLSVARSFFDTYTSPIMFGIAILIAICPHFLFSGVDWKKLGVRFGLGLLIGAVIVVLTWSFWGTNLVGAAAGVVGITGLVMTLSIFVEDYLKKKENFFKSFISSGRRYGGYIAHIGAILMFMGVFAATVYKVETNVTLNPGETAEFKDVKILYEQPVYQKGPNYETFGAQVTLFDSGNKVGRLHPSFSYYPASNQQTYEVDIDWGIFRDVYLSLKEMKFEEPYTATITISLEPLTMFIWLGSLILFVGTTYAIWPRRKFEETPEEA